MQTVTQFGWKLYFFEVCAFHVYLIAVHSNLEYLSGCGCPKATEVQRQDHRYHVGSWYFVKTANSLQGCLEKIKKYSFFSTESIEIYLRHGSLRSYFFLMVISYGRRNTKKEGICNIYCFCHMVHMSFCPRTMAIKCRMLFLLDNIQFDGHKMFSTFVWRTYPSSTYADIFKTYCFCCLKFC